MPMYRVKQGDYLSKIARRHGFLNWRAIYEHPGNAGFRRRRPDPNLIVAGDEVFIPDKESRQVEAPTGKRHIFRLHEPENWLRLSLIWFHRDEKLTGRPYRLEVGGRRFTGTIPTNAVIAHRIPADAETGRLEVDATGGMQPFTWVLHIGYLDPLDEVTGVQQRLANLNLASGFKDSRDDTKTKVAVRAFQEHYRLTVDGIMGPETKEKLRQAHGC